MSAKNRTSAGARRQVWHSVQDNNSAAGRTLGQARFLRIALPIAALLFAAAVIAAVLLPEPIGRIMSRARETKGIGVLIGVPESSPPASSPKCSDYYPESFRGHRGIARGRRGCAVCEPTVCKRGARFPTRLRFHRRIFSRLRHRMLNRRSLLRTPPEASSPAAIAESSSSSSDETRSSVAT